jgi:hypothetical protein
VETVKNLGRLQSDSQSLGWIRGPSDYAAQITRDTSQSRNITLETSSFSLNTFYTYLLPNSVAIRLTCINEILG